MLATLNPPSGCDPSMLVMLGSAIFHTTISRVGQRVEKRRKTVGTEPRCPKMNMARGQASPVGHARRGGKGELCKRRWATSLSHWSGGMQVSVAFQ